MAKLRFAILGCGRISVKHAEAIANNHIEAQLVAVCDIVREKMSATIDRYCKSLRLNGVQVSDDDVAMYVSYHNMLEKEDIDVVTIATESGYHAKHSIDCMNAGKHVIVEKPIALSMTEVDNMIATAKRNYVKLAVCHQNRFNPPIQQLRAAIERGRFGKLVNGTARILWNRNDDYYRQNAWRGTWELDGGTLMNQCIHNIDLLQWMMGGEVASVYAQTGTFLRPIEAEDFGAILIRFKNGAIGIVEGSACVYPTNLEETLSIFGEKGTVVIGGLAVNSIKAWRFADGVDSEDETLAQQQGELDSVYGYGHTPLFKDFIVAVNNDTIPLVSASEGRKSVEIVLAAYVSQKTSLPKRLPLEPMATRDLAQLE